MRLLWNWVAATMRCNFIAEYDASNEVCKLLQSQRYDMPLQAEFYYSGLMLKGLFNG